MKIAYITAKTPYGSGEQFILPEILEIINKGNNVIIIPIRPDKYLAKGSEAEKVSKYSIYVSLLNINVIVKSLWIFIKSPIKVINIVFNILKCSNSFKKILKNISVLPKGLTTGEIIKKNKVEHIHAHWASTPSTVAYIASAISNIPWSFTAHRWDIAENNMLEEKARTAEFIRGIDEQGLSELASIINEKYRYKLNKIHVGININCRNRDNNFLYGNDNNFIIITPANLVLKKGHRYLIEACKLLIKKGITNFKCYFFGDGYLHEDLLILIKEHNLEEYISIKGQIPHNELLNLYKNKNIDLIVLPSIVDKYGNKEGIPSALTEAMAYGIPVISTNTGGIPELIGDGSGIMVNQKDPLALADAIEKLMKDSEYYKTIAEKGRKKVEDEFNVNKIAQELLNLFEINKKTN